MVMRMLLCEPPISMTPDEIPRYLVWAKRARRAKVPRQVMVLGYLEGTIISSAVHAWANSVEVLFVAIDDLVLSQGPLLRTLYIERKAQFFQYVTTDIHILVMAMSLFVYDSIISFNLEWHAVWSRKVTGATALYLALRYVTLVNVIVNVISYTELACELMILSGVNYISIYIVLDVNAQHVGSSGFISELVQIGTICGIYLAQAVFASIRVYAIDGRRWTKAAIVMTLGLIPFALNIFCSVERSLSTNKNNMYVTQFQTSSDCMDQRRIPDGCAIPGWLVVVLNAVVVVAALLLGRHILKMPIRRISTVVLCRFFLNLRHFSSSPDVNNSTISSHRSSFSSFASRIIGNLGEMLEDEPQPSDDDFKGELDEPNDPGDVDGEVDRTTTATFEQEIDGGGAASREIPEAPDEIFDQRVMVIV
ncbi:hypothetical protein IEO21_09861 [Rhodonia placenta]|uniref:DUF6533 domain-containing protein n=1 Tax=Rhodonia placenta TaxID=104341 RepID=A0A8H7TXI2_9APHY|nr:hypothetical protein IEO21_09861 [Postia placenta]